MLADLAGRAPALRGRSLAAQQAVGALGIAIGAPLGGLVVSAYGERAAFLCVSAAAAIALSLYTLLPETVDGGRELSRDGGRDADDGARGGGGGTGSGARRASDAEIARGAESTLGGRWPSLLSDERWRGLALCECGARFGFAAKIASVPVLAASALSGGAAAAGLLVSGAHRSAEP